MFEVFIRYYGHCTKIVSCTVLNEICSRVNFSPWDLFITRWFRSEGGSGGLAADANTVILYYTHLGRPANAPPAAFLLHLSAGDAQLPTAANPDWFLPSVINAIGPK